MKLLPIALLLRGITAFKGPQNVKELVQQVYGEYEAPEFVPLPGWDNIAIAHNDSALLKIMDLDISHYPIKMGRITFELKNLLTKQLPENSVMEVFSYIDGEVLYEGPVDLCKYLAYGKLDCPLPADDAPKVTKEVLQVPEYAEDSRLAFFAMAFTPQHELLLEIAGLVDFVQDGTYAEEDLHLHEEL